MLAICVQYREQTVSEYVPVGEGSALVSHLFELLYREQTVSECVPAGEGSALVIHLSAVQ